MKGSGLSKTMMFYSRISWKEGCCLYSKVGSLQSAVQSCFEGLGAQALWNELLQFGLRQISRSSSEAHFLQMQQVWLNSSLLELGKAGGRVLAVG